MSDEFLTVAEIAELLKINQQTVRNLIDRGELPAVRIGSRRVRVLRSDLDAFLAEGRRLTRKSPARVAYEDAAGTANKALRGGDRVQAAEALRTLATAAIDLANTLQPS